MDNSMVLVIGGCGLVGRAIVEQLLDQGRAVRVLDVVPHPDSRVESLVGSLTTRSDVERACQGVDSVFLCAALIDWGWGNAAGLHAVNVQGPITTIEVCQHLGVKRLIYTSSIDVVFDGTPITNGDETLPYPERHLDIYGATKALGEQAVLAANGHGGLATCALRLGGVYGPHDTNRLPTLLEIGKKNPVPRIGNGKAQFSHVYVENAAHAHVLAEQHLTADGVMGGQAYFIVDPQPANFFAFVRPFLAKLGVSMARYSIPFAVAYPLALVSEAWFRVTRSKRKPSLTRYTVLSTCVDFWFNAAKAARDFGYAPLVDDQEAFERTISWLQQTYDIPKNQRIHQATADH